MTLPKDRNDRVMLVTLAGLVSIGLAVGLSNTTITAPASADPVTAPPRSDVLRAQPARGPVPHAHTTTKVRPRSRPHRESGCRAASIRTNSCSVRSSGSRSR